MSHPCPTGCGVPDVPDDRLACRQCWGLIPKPLQQAVYRNWDHGRGRGSQAHTAAMRAAIEAASRPSEQTCVNPYPEEGNPS